MKQTFFAICICIFSIYNQAEAQALRIGDTVPHTRLPASNYKKDYIDLAEFKGKTTLLVFWSYICVNCFKSFPKIDSLQREFGENVQIIMVDRHSAASTDSFFQKRKRIFRPDLPMIHDTAVMPKLFPYNSVPFHVWIDKNGKVLHKTGGFSTTRENLASVINGGKLRIAEYEPVYFKPSLFDTSYKEDLTYFSYLSRCIGNLHLTSLRGGPNELYYSCQSVASLYVKAYNEGGKFKFDRPGRVRYMFRDSSRYVLPSDRSVIPEWLASNGYNYHQLVPKELGNRRFQIMREDLNRVFPVTAQPVTRRVKCLVLGRLPNIDRLRTKGGQPKRNFVYLGLKAVEEYNKKELQNVPYSEFSGIMSGTLETIYQMPVVDSTGFKGNIDIALTPEAIDTENLRLLQSELKKYGILLEEKVCPIKILELTDR
ncbi:TlpA family protein disulfide reductase [Chitinophaga defluvii]|uniref:TlpA disulfide reductase family protein n=1 Tax=Chitinophaga defluvii TaxID=3163343 RepID=A0ABV2T8N9_9BACT